MGFRPAQFANWNQWSAYVFQHPPTGTGCFVVTYPSTAWEVSVCTTVPTVPVNVGDGYSDKTAQAPSGKIIGNSIGLFQSISGLTSESDSVRGTNYYSLQVNSQRFTTSTTYTGGKSATGWEQFLFLNNPGSSYSSVYIEYFLIGYYTTYHTCPTTGPPGGTKWMQDSSGDCYATSAGASSVPHESASSIYELSLGGFANSGQSGNDEVLLCVFGGSCYSVSLTEHVLDLYKSWQDSEFNVFGYCCNSQANFNSGTSWTLWNSLEDQNYNVIVPSCVSTSYTGETNNLNLGSCSPNSGGRIVYTESN